MRCNPTDMRYGLRQRVMTARVLHLILSSHTPDPCYPVYLFGWRQGPSDRLTIYDLHLPKREGIDDDMRIGYAADEWWARSAVANVPAAWMGPYSGAYCENVCERPSCGWSLVETEQREFCPKCAWPISYTVPTPGYKNVLVGLLASGSILPSRALDEWLGDSSRKFAAPFRRLWYLRN